MYEKRNNLRFDSTLGITAGYSYFPTCLTKASVLNPALSIFLDFDFFGREQNITEHPSFPGQYNVQTQVSTLIVSAQGPSLYVKI